MHIAHLLLAAALLASTTAAMAINPKPISSAKQLKPGQGALRLSWQAQVQQNGAIHLWFLREGGDSSRDGDVLRFKRGQGVPLMGSNNVDSRDLVYAVAPGRYHLAGFAVGCGDLPPPGAYACSARMNGIPMGEWPVRRYTGETPVIVVEAGKLTDAGEFILEAAPGSPITEEAAVKGMVKNRYEVDVRVRPFADPLRVDFSGLPGINGVTVPDPFRSQISCRARPKGAMMYVPFTC